MSDPYDHYSPAFQSRMLALLVHYPENSLAMIDPSYFTLQMHANIARAIHNAYTDKDVKNNCLTATTLITLVSAFLRKNKKEAIENKRAYKQEIRKLFKMQLPDHEIILDEARAFARQVQYREALVEAEKQINAKNYDAVPKLFEELGALRKSGNNAIALPVSTLSSFLREESQFEDATNYLVHPIVPKGGAILLYGLPKELKSWMGAALALDVSAGRKALGFFNVPSPIKTLYVQVEDPEHLTRRRLQELQQKQGPRKSYSLFMLNVVPRCGLNLFDPAWLTMLTKEIAKSKPKFIVLDVLRRLFRGNVTDSKETADFLAIIDKFRDDYGCAVMLVHHAKKGETSEMQTKALGSINLTAWADVLLYVSGKRQKGSASVSKLQIESKATTNPQENLLLRVDEDALPMASVLQESKFELDPILAAVTQEPGLNQRELQEKIGYPEKKLRDLLKIAKAKGLLREKRGLGKTLQYFPK